MAIVCGTDFSDQARTAGDAAAALAKRLSDGLVLLHVSRMRETDEEIPPARATELVHQRSKTAQALADQAADLRKRGVEVDEVIEAGEADEVVSGYAERTGARAIVIGTHGRRGPRAWVVGSVAARTAQSAGCPVVVFRGPAERWTAWGAGKGSLKVFCGIDFSPATERALELVRTLMAAGDVELKTAHVLWPPAEQERQGAQVDPDKGVPLHHPDLTTSPNPTQMRATLERDLAKRMQALLPGAPPCEIRMNWGRTADLIVDWAQQEKADLIVVGTRQIKGLAKVWEGSVAQGVIAASSIPIICVPPA